MAPRRSAEAIELAEPREDRGSRSDSAHYCTNRFWRGALSHDRSLGWSCAVAQVEVAAEVATSPRLARPQGLRLRVEANRHRYPRVDEATDYQEYL